MSTIQSTDTLAGLSFAHAPITDPEVKADFSSGALVRRVESLGKGRYRISTAVPLHRESDIDDFELNGTVEWVWASERETDRDGLTSRYSLECHLWTYMCTVTRVARMAAVSTSHMYGDRVAPAVAFLLDYADLEAGRVELFAVDRRCVAPAIATRVEAVEWVQDHLSGAAFSYMDRND